jgi:hypothetical protein
MARKLSRGRRGNGAMSTAPRERVDQHLQATELVRAVGQQPALVGRVRRVLGAAQQPRPVVPDTPWRARGAGRQDHQGLRRRDLHAIADRRPEQLGRVDHLGLAAADVVGGDDEGVIEAGGLLVELGRGLHGRVHAGLGAGQGGATQERQEVGRVVVEDPEPSDAARGQVSGGRFGLGEELAVGGDAIVVDDRTVIRRPL